MKATEILMEEHRIILKVLDCLEKMAQEAEKTGKLNAQAAQKVIDFFRNFADGCHHAKEENRLFGVLEEHGVPREGGPIGVMLYEHDEGRRLIRGMVDTLEQASEGDAQAVQAFNRYARDYIFMLRNHINKEDQVLFPMADHVVPENMKENLLEDFKKIEQEAGNRRHREYIQLARQLCEQYQVPFLNEDQIPNIHLEFLTQ